MRFLGDVKIAGSLSPMNRIVAGVAPLAFGLGIVGGTYSGVDPRLTRLMMTVLVGIVAVAGIQMYMKKKKRGVATILVDHWNAVNVNPWKSVVCD